MWIVRLALNRPYTFIVVALLILMLAPVAILRTPTDIFPNIDIPVIAAAWQYTGLNPQEMAGQSAGRRVERRESTEALATCLARPKGSRI
jgi:multidrug efflux pump subunit AcrB